MTPSRKTFVQWRAVAWDSPDDPDAESVPGERGIAFGTRELAQQDLDEILNSSQPPYDEGWIERREVTSWERAD